LRLRAVIAVIPDSDFDQHQHWHWQRELRSNHLNNCQQLERAA
jgi:hypothetical protein